MKVSPHHLIITQTVRSLANLEKTVNSWKTHRANHRKAGVQLAKLEAKAKTLHATLRSADRAIVSEALNKVLRTP